MTTSTQKFFQDLQRSFQARSAELFVVLFHNIFLFLDIARGIKQNQVHPSSQAFFSHQLMRLQKLSEVNVVLMTNRLHVLQKLSLPLLHILSQGHHRYFNSLYQHVSSFTSAFHAGFTTILCSLCVPSSANMLKRIERSLMMLGRSLSRQLNGSLYQICWLSNIFETTISLVSVCKITWHF